MKTQNSTKPTDLAIFDAYALHSNTKKSLSESTIQYMKTEVKRLTEEVSIQRKTIIHVSHADAPPPIVLSTCDTP